MGSSAGGRASGRAVTMPWLRSRRPDPNSTWSVAAICSVVSTCGNTRALDCGRSVRLPIGLRARNERARRAPSVSLSHRCSASATTVEPSEKVSR
jgi:hypothetical protein